MVPALPQTRPISPRLYLRAGLLPRLVRDDRNYLTLPVIRRERAAINGQAGLLRSLEAAFAERRLAKPRAEIREAIEGER